MTVVWSSKSRLSRG